MEYKNEILLVILIAIAMIIYLFTKRNIKKMESFAKDTETKIDDKLIGFWKKFNVLVLLLLVVIGGLWIYGVNITPLLAGAGVASVIIGLAIKELLSDMFAGISIMTDRPFTEGDRIEVRKISGHWGGWGDVKEIGLRRSKVENTDGVIINYPNSLLAQSTIVNFSDKNDEHKPVRVRIRFSVDWHSDIETAMKVSEEAIFSTLKIAKEKGYSITSFPDTLTNDKDSDNPKKEYMPYVLIRSLWDDSLGSVAPGILLEGRYYLNDVRDRTKVRSIVLNGIITTLRKNKISFPKPNIIISNNTEK